MKLTAYLARQITSLILKDMKDNPRIPLRHPLHSTCLRSLVVCVTNLRVRPNRSETGGPIYHSLLLPTAFLLLQSMAENWNYIRGYLQVFMAEMTDLVK